MATDDVTHTYHYISETRQTSRVQSKNVFPCELMTHICIHLLHILVLNKVATKNVIAYNEKQNAYHISFKMLTMLISMYKLRVYSLSQEKH